MARLVVQQCSSSGQLYGPEDGQLATAGQLLRQAACEEHVCWCLHKMGSNRFAAERAMVAAQLTYATRFVVECG